MGLIQSLLDAILSHVSESNSFLRVLVTAQAEEVSGNISGLVNSAVTSGLQTVKDGYADLEKRLEAQKSATSISKDDIEAIAKKLVRAAVSEEMEHSSGTWSPSSSSKSLLEMTGDDYGEDIPYTYDADGLRDSKRTVSFDTQNFPKPIVRS